MPVLDDREEPLDFVDEAELALKWRQTDNMQWWDDVPGTPGVEVWTDLRPTSVRRGRPRVPGAEVISRPEGMTDVEAVEGPGEVEEPKIRADWLSIAKSQIGAPYVWADANPEGMIGGPGSGFDCSGFTAWLYSEAFGISLPHQSTDQANSTQKISKKNLRSGDLVFFSYGRLGAGVVDHVEIYLGNGKSIGTPSATRGVGIDEMDWSHFVQGGRVSGADTSFEPPTETDESRRGRDNAESEGRDWWNDPTMIPASMGLQPNLADVQVGLMMDARDEIGRRDDRNDSTPNMSGSQSIQQIKKQLYRGFLDAGRPDLAKMVNTKDFSTWMQAEAGWDPYVVSRYYPNHGRNAGLFQFMLGDREWVLNDVNHSDGDWTYSSSPYMQARNVVRYFDLSAADIKQYAEQIRNGTYSGWG